MNADRALIYAIASVALRYPPDEEDARAEVSALARSLGRSKANDGLRASLEWWAGTDPLAVRQRYVETFDLHKRCGLYLSYYLYGDRRQRGQEFVRLKRLYESAGLRLAGRELPDYLPLMLEFAALEPDAGTKLLAEWRVGLELVRAALADAESPWQAVVDAVCECLPRLDEAGDALVRRLAEEGPPDEQVGLEPYGPPEAMPEPVMPRPTETSWIGRR